MKLRNLGRKLGFMKVFEEMWLMREVDLVPFSKKKTWRF